MIAGTSIALFAVLTLSVGACSDGAASSVSTPSASSTSSSTLDTLVVRPPTLLPTSTTATVPAVSNPDSTAAAGTVGGTTQVVRTSTPPPAVSNGTSVPNQEPTESSAPPPTSDGVDLVDMDCTAVLPDASFDLVHVTVESSTSQYRLVARYSGDTFRHDVLVSFDLGESTYLVTAELFEDGNGVARVSGIGSSEDVFLDPPQTITPGLVDVTVRHDQMSGLGGTPFSVRVSLKVDGSEIETCH